MAYCSPGNVRAICDTDVTDAELTELIEETDALMDAKLSTASINTNILRAISRTWTAIRCMLKDPASEAFGSGYRGDKRYTLEKLNKELNALIKIADGGISFSYSYEALPTSYIATTG